MVLRGCELVVGFKISEVPGDLLREKAAYLNGLSGDDFHKLSSKCGFEVVVGAGSAIVVPPGFLVMVVTGSSGVSGLRWGLSLQVRGESDTTIVVTTVNQMLTAYPSLQQAPLGDFKKALEVMQC